MLQTNEIPSKLVEVFSLLNPSNNIDLNLNGKIAKAAIIAYVYTVTGPRRVKPSQEPEKGMYRALRSWVGLTVPPYVVVREATEGALVVEWDGKQTRQGSAPWKRPIVGRLSLPPAGVWGVEVDPSYVFPGRTRAAPGAGGDRKDGISSALEAQDAASPRVSRRSGAPAGSSSRPRRTCTRRRPAVHWGPCHC